LEPTTGPSVRIVMAGEKEEKYKNFRFRPSLLCGAWW
jgi:hypothetical protein